jgi:Photosynthesis system II assembly factor YCF48/Putative zinc-finger
VKQIPTNALRRQLAHSQPAGPHPDADLLTAFAEDSLLGRERAEVGAHLASCESCRAILHASTTAAEPEPAFLPQSKAVPTPPRAWLPAFVIAACLFVMATSTVLFYRATRAHVPGAQTATSAPPPLPAAKAPPSPAFAPRPQTTATPTQARPPAAAPPKHVRTPVQQRPPAPTPPLQTDEAEASTQATAAPAEGAISGLSLSATSSRNAPPPPDRAQDKAQMRAQLQAEMVARHGTAVAAKAPPQTTANAAFAPMNRFTGGESRQQAAVIGGFMTQPATHPRFRINDNGQIERALAPETWQSVPVDQQVRFRVLSVSGQEIWAGGDHLRLFHSIDNGVTWIQIQLPPGADRSHAIAHIRFEPGQRVVIEADDGATWTTTDSGQTWQ